MRKMKVIICFLVVFATGTLSFQFAGSLFHAKRRSNLQLTKKISDSRIAAVTGDHVIGISDDTNETGGKPTEVEAVLFANAVQAAVRLPQAMDGLSSIRASDRMTFGNLFEVGVEMEVCRLPHALGRFPSFFDSKQNEAIGTDLIVRRIRSLDMSRFDETIAALKKGDHAIWCGHPGIGKSTEANFVLIEFLRHLGDGEDSGWPTKVAHRVGGQLFLYCVGFPNLHRAMTSEVNESGVLVLNNSRSWGEGTVLHHTTMPIANRSFHTCWANLLCSNSANQDFCIAGAVFDLHDGVATIVKLTAIEFKLL